MVSRQSPECLSVVDQSPKLKSPKIEVIDGKEQKWFSGLQQLLDLQCLESTDLASFIESSYKRSHSPPLVPSFPYADPTWSDAVGEEDGHKTMLLEAHKYMLAEGFGLSGIVSILFTGIVMKHYTFSNLSENSQRFVASFFHLISSLAETYVAANVFSCAYLVNLVRPAHRQIPLKHQKALWYSGLRGAMAFALALQSVHELPEGHGQTIFTATTAIVILTVDYRYGELQQSNYVAPSCEEGTSSGSRIKMKLKEFHKNTATFTALDKNYLTPFFTTQNDDEDDPDDNSDSGGGFRGPH
ncbi:hypothetical protein J5N97_026329 [Dioscorea zingiberensis]|uniref:Cation/H+ exchanger transmembrane domain-containing protein n=1 Tax=Dioscorea zingiberensis TaxID=325984 RepID=A0A9D5H6L2_9LILI|nr:hypothetical protein J5N97_026329 [Dioscorea zingiberensis]